jgi:hypothetical protein
MVQLAECKPLTRLCQRSKNSHGIASVFEIPQEALLPAETIHAMCTTSTLEAENWRVGNTLNNRPSHQCGASKSDDQSDWVTHGLERCDGGSALDILRGEVSGGCQGASDERNVQSEVTSKWKSGQRRKATRSCGQNQLPLKKSETTSANGMVNHKNDHTIL